APILAGMEATARNYTVHGFSVAVTDALTVSASRSKLTGATVWIGSNFTEGEDVLNVTATAEIAGEFDGETGVLTLSGTSARANYEAVLRSVTYMNTSSDPNPAIRTIHFQVDDGDSIGNLSNIATREIAINRHPIAKDDVLERYPGMPT